MLKKNIEKVSHSNRQLCNKFSQTVVGNIIENWWNFLEMKLRVMFYKPSSLTNKAESFKLFLPSKFNLWNEENFFKLFGANDLQGWLM